MKTNTDPVFKTLRYSNARKMGNTRHITDDCNKDRRFEPCSRYYHMLACFSAVWEALTIGPTVLLNVETNSDATESAAEHKTK